MKVIAPDSFSHVTPLERGVTKGDEIEVDDVLGEQLLAQGWKTKGTPRRAEIAPPAQEED